MNDNTITENVKPLAQKKQPLTQGDILRRSKPHLGAALHKEKGLPSYYPAHDNPNLTIDELALSKGQYLAGRKNSNYKKAGRSRKITRIQELAFRHVDSAFEVICGLINANKTNHITLYLMLCALAATMQKDSPKIAYYSEADDCLIAPNAGLYIHCMRVIFEGYAVHSSTICKMLKKLADAGLITIVNGGAKKLDNGRYYQMPRLITLTPRLLKLLGIDRTMSANQRKAEKENAKRCKYAAHCKTYATNKIGITLLRAHRAAQAMAALSARQQSPQLSLHPSQAPPPLPS